MVLIEADPPLGQVRRAVFDERRRHADTDRVDGLQVRAMGEQIGGQGHIMVAAGPRGLVDGNKLANAGEVGITQRQIDVALTDRRDPMPDLAAQTRHRLKRHLAGQHQYERLEQQREARELSGPVRLHVAHRTAGQHHPREADLKVALVLEEVQVPVALAHRVMRRMDPCLPGHGEPAAGGKVDANAQRLRRCIQVNRRHMTRLGNPQSSLEKFLVQQGTAGCQRGTPTICLPTQNSKEAEKMESDLDIKQEENERCWVC